MSRLPIVNSDDGTWGSILNDFLTQSLNIDGTLKGSAVSTAGAEMTSHKGQANGYAPLDGSSKLPLANLPSTIPATNLGPAPTNTKFLRGDNTWVTPAGGGTVTSVNSGTAINVDNTDPANPIVNNTGVTQFNTRTGNVTLSKADVTGTGVTVGDLGASDDVLDMGTNKIVNMGDGTAPNDAVAMDQIAAVGFSGAYTDLSGTPASLPPTGSAGGDLSGSYPNPTVSQINGAAPTSLPVGGDITGTVGNATVASITGIPLSGSPSNGQVLTYNSTGPQINWDTPGGGGGISGSGTTGKIPVFTGSTALGNGSVSDDGSSHLSLASVNAPTITLNESTHSGTFTILADGNGTGSRTRATLLTSDGEVLMGTNQGSGDVTMSLDRGAAVARITNNTNNWDFANTGVATFPGALHVGGKVTNVTDPSSAQDAATKHYVDNINTVDGITISGTPSAGQVLTATSSSAADWQAGGGGGLSRSVTSVSGTTTAGAAANTDYVYLCTGTITLTLPTAVSNTNLYTVKNVGTGVITIATTSAQTIDGVTTNVLNSQYNSVSVISDNSNWNIV